MRDALAFFQLPKLELGATKEAKMLQLLTTACEQYHEFGDRAAFRSQAQLVVDYLFCDIVELLQEQLNWGRAQIAFAETQVSEGRQHYTREVLKVLFIPDQSLDVRRRRAVAFLLDKAPILSTLVANRVLEWTSQESVPVILLSPPPPQKVVEPKLVKKQSDVTTRPRPGVID